MARVLYLVHRLPYPPDKGDKVRSYHLLRHLAARHEVLLGTFVDDPADEPHVDAVRRWCSEVMTVRLQPRRARIASLSGLARGEPLTLAYYRDAALDAWVRRLRAEGRIDAVVVFSSSMAPYAEAFLGSEVPVLVDFVDVDSAKWADYARAHRWPLSWLYAREGRELLAYERRVAARASRSFFATEQEAALFRRLAPECASRVEALCNGVDARHFAPESGRGSPFDAGTTPIVFTGAMDYWPNVDAVQWFVREVLPRIVARRPEARFFIVGRNPSSAVQALAGAFVAVTGTVDDVRPYLQHAALVVAPLRLARGIQNKVLEAMAMARPVVASQACAGPIGAGDGAELLSAADSEGFAAQVERLLADPSFAERVGQSARRHVLAGFAWDAQLAGIDRCFIDESPRIAA
ncbi:MAG: TIGR03087 family PEP-CTERM/XrtA system glycosyltransferase [Burkholderiales bacterium]|nr:TIGR03087 family PEP-CTERM/XrtA system glycosyltransferase [Burkholderiales bacterium]